MQAGNETNVHSVLIKLSSWDRNNYGDIARETENSLRIAPLWI